MYAVEKMRGIETCEYIYVVYCLGSWNIFLFLMSHGINAIIDAPALYSFIYSGFLEPRFSFRAPKLYTCSLEPLDEELVRNSEPWKHFHKLRFSSTIW